LAEISSNLGISYPKLIKEFDKIDIAEGLQEEIIPTLPINLLIDATFFGRDYGYLCFHDTKRVIYFKEIKTETVRDLRIGLLALKKAKYKINSVTIDGRRGYINNIRKIIGNIPIQMCLFHQKAIIRRYITDRPTTKCGKDLKELAKTICQVENQQNFIDNFYKLKNKYQHFLHQRNDKGEYKHTSTRSAFRSIEFKPAKSVYL